VVLAKKGLMEMEDKLLLSQRKEDAEGRERARKLGSSRRQLQTARDKVKDAEERNEMLQTKVLRFQHDIEEANKKELECEACASKNISDFKGIHSEVCALQEVYSQLEMKNKQANDRNRSLEADWQKEVCYIGNPHRTV
jgi:chromosome segregation ATPase